MEALHGVVHRDLTPGNVFLCNDGQVKVLDFGMAHAFGQKKLDGGTRSYMAPEQLRGAPEDERTDVFALGVVLYLMMSAELPFTDRQAVEDARPAPRLEVAEEPGLGDPVAQTLKKDLVERPRDAGEALAALNTFQHCAESRRTMAFRRDVRLGAHRGVEVPPRARRARRAAARRAAARASASCNGRSSLSPIRSTARSRSSIGLRWIACGERHDHSSIDPRHSRAARL